MRLIPIGFGARDSSLDAGDLRACRRHLRIRARDLRPSARNSGLKIGALEPREDLTFFDPRPFFDMQLGQPALNLCRDDGTPPRNDVTRRGENGAAGGEIDAGFDRRLNRLDLNLRTCETPDGNRGDDRDDTNRPRPAPPPRRGEHA